MKAEISSLEYAVCALVARLELLLIEPCGRHTLRFGDGFTMSTPDHLPLHSDAFVTIVPRSWPEGSRIDARFLRSIDGWHLFEGGEIWAPHIGLWSRVRLVPTDRGYGFRLNPLHSLDQSRAWHGYEELISALSLHKRINMHSSWSIG